MLTRSWQALVLLPSLWLTYQPGSSVSPDDNISVDVRSSLWRTRRGPLNRNYKCSNRLPAH